MKFWASLILLFSVNSVATVKPKAVPVAPDHVQFDFASQDGELTAACTHKIRESTQDFIVRCGDRSFDVHLYLTKYQRAQAPKMSYEVLYWVTNPAGTAGSGNKYLGSTIWFRLKDPSELMVLELGQDVEDVFTLNARVTL